MFFLCDSFMFKSFFADFYFVFVYLGAGIVSKRLWFWGDNGRREAAMRCVRLQLCFLVPTLDSHVFGGSSNLVRFLQMSAASKMLWLTSLITWPVFSQKIFQLSLKCFLGHHSEKTRENYSPRDIVLAKHTCSLWILVTSDWRNWVSIP